MHLLEENRVSRCRDSRRSMLEEWDEEQEDLKFGRKGKDQVYKTRSFCFDFMIDFFFLENTTFEGTIVRFIKSCQRS